MTTHLSLFISWQKCTVKLPKVSFSCVQVLFLHCMLPEFNKHPEILPWLLPMVYYCSCFTSNSIFLRFFKHVFFNLFFLLFVGFIVYMTLWKWNNQIKLVLMKNYFKLNLDYFKILISTCIVYKSFIKLVKYTSIWLSFS